MLNTNIFNNEFDKMVGNRAGNKTCVSVIRFHSVINPGCDGCVLDDGFIVITGKCECRSPVNDTEDEETDWVEEPTEIIDSHRVRCNVRPTRPVLGRLKTHRISEGKFNGGNCPVLRDEAGGELSCGGVVMVMLVVQGSHLGLQGVPVFSSGRVAATGVEVAHTKSSAAKLLVAFLASLKVNINNS